MSALLFLGSPSSNSKRAFCPAQPACPAEPARLDERLATCKSQALSQCIGLLYAVVETAESLLHVHLAVRVLQHTAASSDSVSLLLTIKSQHQIQSGPVQSNAVRSLLILNLNLNLNCNLQSPISILCRPHLPACRPARCCVPCHLALALVLTSLGMTQARILSSSSTSEWQPTASVHATLASSST